MFLKSSLAVLSLMLASSAIAQPSGDRRAEPDRQNNAGKADDKAHHDDKTLDTAGHIVSQPARDVGIAKTKIPPILAAAAKQPYGAPASRTCAGYTRAISQLNAVLGPDFGSNSAENENKFGKLAAAGGEAVVNTLIPFRGLVREVSGAAPAERRLDAAINAGLARRGYLRGMAQSKGCKLPAGGAIRLK